jgi:membrane dipeptidase
MNAEPLRLVDLHVDWLLQYAPETTVFDPASYPGVTARLGQVEGYLGETWAAVLSCYRDDDEWSRASDPWQALGSLLARLEAEFPGRLLYGPDDLARCLDDPQGLCWGVVGVEGFDRLVREPGDLDRLPGLFERGVRLFQPVYTASSLLGGSSAPGDDRGLTELGRAFLQTLADLGGEGLPRPLLDLAHLNPRSAGEVLDWFEAESSRAARVLPLYSHGALTQEGLDSPRALTLENLRRLRALGGVVGFTPAFYASADLLKRSIETAASVPFQGRAGLEGIALGTDFLGVDETPPGFGNVAEVAAWAAASFPPADASALLQRNGLALLRRCLGTPV